MTPGTHSSLFDDLPPAVESGRICAVAGQAARDTQRWTARFGRLFSAKPFDPTLYHTVCGCISFSAPWATSEELRVANRAALWGFGVDWLIDYIATSRAEVEQIVTGCLAVADGGAPPDDDLLLSLADIRADLAGAPAWPALRPVWRGQLARFLRAMAHEWDWRQQGEKGRPTFTEYLGNADNFGFSFAFASHWAFTSPPMTEREIAAVQDASWAAQRTGRLINDLGTYERDLEWGDLNALLLDVGRDEIDRHIAELTREFRKAAAPVRAEHPRLALYLERQLEFCTGFYGATDYWGDL
ncbi:terpene synthase family protein [Actinomadura sp. 3N508]|uniref:terpene synthase family protein n=1 Tax=Actinomadura sp. 3N508 TaxID=3375153 RepID=UPI0037AC603E